MNEFITKPRLRGKFFTSAVFVHETSFNSSAGHSENSFMQHFANLHFQNETELTKFSRLTWTYIKVILDSNCLFNRYTPLTRLGSFATYAIQKQCSM